MEDYKDKGYIFLPYKIKTEKTEINGETVWYANKWKNLFLKIKIFFIKPKYIKNGSKFDKKIINKYYYNRSRRKY